MYGINEIKNSLWFIVAAALLTAGQAKSETAAFDPFASALSGKTVNQNADPNASGGEGAASKIAAGMVSDGSKVVDSTATNKNQGREQKAADSASQSGTGKGVAIGTGAALMATAIPMLASIDPATRATGAALMAKAGLEFAQAAADGGTQKANKAQEDLLRSNSDQNIGQASQAANEQGKKDVQNQVANAVAGNADLQKVLGQNGVNADDFAKQFASGGLLSPEAILSATGSAGVDPGSMAQGLVNASHEPLGKQSTLTAIQEDSEKENSSKPSKPDQGSAGGQSLTVDDRKSPGATGDKSRGGAIAPNGLAGLLDSATKGGVSALAGIKNASDGELASMLAGLMGMGGGEAKTDGSVAKKILDKDALAKQGILKATGKSGIFMLARRNYRSFQKWRRNTIVAANQR